MCDEPPLSSDFIGIYPADAETRYADETWWSDTVCRQFPGACEPAFQFGYEEGMKYVWEGYTWFTWTCGAPEDGGCQTKATTTWPSRGSITIDPNVGGAGWAFPGGRTLAPGNYKVLMNREMYYISPPPYPTICSSWDEAIEFTVP